MMAICFRVVGLAATTARGIGAGGVGWCGPFPSLGFPRLASLRPLPIPLLRLALALALAALACLAPDRRFALPSLSLHRLHEVAERREELVRTLP